MGRREKPLPADDTRPTIGTALRRARHQRGFSLTALATALRYTKGHLSAVETGAVTPSRELIAAYERALQVSRGALTGMATPAREPQPGRAPDGAAPRRPAAPGLKQQVDRAFQQAHDLLTETVRDASIGDDDITVTFQIHRGTAETEGDHQDLVRREVTRQAAAYAGNPAIADPERIARLIRAIDPPREARVLDVATGPGYVARGFAAVCREVVGIDFTPAPLAIAECLRRDHGLENVRFALADARCLEFGAAEFDVVVCRFTLHHLENPAVVLAEMARVCRPSGIVAIEDLLASEHPDRAAYQNQIERLRDPSHVRALPLSETLGLFTAAGLELTTVRTDELTPKVETWLADAQTPADRAGEVRALIERDRREDLSGMRPFRRDGEVVFHQPTAVIAARRLP